MSHEEMQVESAVAVSASRSFLAILANPLHKGHKFFLAWPFSSRTARTSASS